MDRVLRLQEASGELVAEAPVEVSTGTSAAGRIPVLGSSGLLDASVLPPIPAARYVHEQGTPSDTWVVVHNLNAYPSVTVVDTANERWSTKVVYDSANQLTISFAAAFSGKAFLN